MAQELEGEIHVPFAGRHDAHRRHAADREPPQPVSEDHQKNDAQPEDGNAAEHGRQDDTDQLQPGAAFPGEQDATGNADDHGDERRRDHEDNRVQELVRQHRPDGLLIGERNTEIAAQQVPDIGEELLRQRPVEAPVPSQGVPHIFRNVRRQDHGHRVCRDEAKQDEHQRRQHDKQHDVQQRTPNDIVDHEYGLID